MHGADFDLLLTHIRHYLLRKNESRDLQQRMQPNSEGEETEKPAKATGKTKATRKTKKKSSEDMALNIEKAELDTNIQLLKKSIGFIAIRSIWPGNTHRCYSHPKGNRDLAANQRKSDFHKGRFLLMTRT
jgi:hypothetical protein